MHFTFKLGASGGRLPQLFGLNLKGEGGKLGFFTDLEHFLRREREAIRQGRDLSFSYMRLLSPDRLRFAQQVLTPTWTFNV